MTAIFKKGDRTDGSNYRPITLTSIICRIMESLLRDAIVSHLVQYNLIRSSQHFWCHRSCLTNLLEFLEIVTKFLFYLDFSRAFDKVPHQRLLQRVRSHGITGKIANWIEDWLKDRQQRVVLNGKASPWSKVTSGVPQGSVLGPCLFIIYINDIDQAIDAVLQIMKFADDTKGCAIADTEEDCCRIQNQLDKIHQWSLDWQMLFNTDKCKVIHIGPHNPRYNYKIGEEYLKKVDYEKDLGAYIDCSLTPSMQIAEAVMKATQVLGQLLRAVSYRDKTHFVKLYKERVRCHLEHVVQSWSPWLAKDIEKLESVQRRAVRCIRGLTGTYEEKLKEIGLTTLKERRERGDMIQTFKIVNGIDDVDYKQWFTLLSEAVSYTHLTLPTKA